MLLCIAGSCWQDHLTFRLVAIMVVNNFLLLFLFYPDSVPLMGLHFALKAVASAPRRTILSELVGFVENRDLSTDLGSRQAESWNLTAFGLKQMNSDPIALRSAQAELSDPCSENTSGIGL
jgi:hypothetical protein